MTCSYCPRNSFIILSNSCENTQTNKQITYFIIIQNEIYSMKSYVVNFHVQMSSSLKVRGVNNGFHKWKEKWYVQSESRVMFFQVFSWKLKCNSFVHFTVHQENCRELAKQQQKGTNKTRCKLKLDFLLELFYTLGELTTDCFIKVWTA